MLLLGAWALFLLFISPPGGQKVCVVNAIQVLISSHPTCELWLYDRGLQNDSGEWIVSVVKERKMPGASIAADLTLTHGYAVLPVTEAPPRTVPHNCNDVASGGDVYMLWPHTEFALSVNITSIVTRPRLQLLQDFNLFVENAIQKRWILFREGDDFELVANQFLYSHAPMADHDQFLYLRDKIHSVYQSRLLDIVNIRLEMATAAKESYALQGSINMIVGDVTEKTSIVTGSGVWLHLSVNTLDLTEETCSNNSDSTTPISASTATPTTATATSNMTGFYRITDGIPVDRIVAEHVWEHLSLAEAVVAARNCYSALAPGGTLRIAVPDLNYALFHRAAVNRSSSSSEPLSPIERVSSLGALDILKADIQDDHMVQWSACSLSEALRAAGFNAKHITPVEYTDHTGATIITDWRYSDGPIERSSKGAQHKPTSLIVDARKPFLFEHRSDCVNDYVLPADIADNTAAKDTPVQIESPSRHRVAIDCTHPSLSRSQPELFDALVEMLPKKMTKLFGSNFSVIVLLSGDSDHGVESLSPGGARVRHKIIDSISALYSKNNTLAKHNISISYVANTITNKSSGVNSSSSNSAYSLHLAREVLQQLAARQIDYLITNNNVYYKSSSEKGGVLSDDLAKINTLNIITVYSVMFEGEDRIPGCRVPFVTSFTTTAATTSSTATGQTDDRANVSPSVTCTNTRVGLSIAEFGSSIEDTSVVNFREMIVRSACEGKSNNYKSKIRNNPYVVISIDEYQCTALKYYGTSGHGSAHPNEPKPSGAGGIEHNNSSLYKIGTALWSLVDGIAEGSSSLPPEVRPWLLFLGNCDWTNGSSSGESGYSGAFDKLEDIDWVSVGNVDRLPRNTIMMPLYAGALALVHLPTLTNINGLPVLTYYQLPLLQSLGIGCPVLTWCPMGRVDLLLNIKGVIKSMTNNVSYITSYVDDAVLSMQRVEPLSVWHALRIIIARSKYGNVVSGVEAKQRRRNNIWRARDQFIGWNNLVSVIMDHLYFAHGK